MKRQADTVSVDACGPGFSVRLLRCSCDVVVLLDRGRADASAEIGGSSAEKRSGGDLAIL